MHVFLFILFVFITKLSPRRKWEAHTVCFICFVLTSDMLMRNIKNTAFVLGFVLNTCNSYKTHVMVGVAVILSGGTLLLAKLFSVFSRIFVIFSRFLGKYVGMLCLYTSVVYEVFLAEIWQFLWRIWIFPHA